VGVDPDRGVVDLLRAQQMTTTRGPLHEVVAGQLALGSDFDGIIS